MNVVGRQLELDYLEPMSLLIRSISFVLPGLSFRGESEKLYSYNQRTTLVEADIISLSQSIRTFYVVILAASFFASSCILSVHAIDRGTVSEILVLLVTGHSCIVLGEPQLYPRAVHISSNQDRYTH